MGVKLLFLDQVELAPEERRKNRSQRTIHGPTENKLKNLLLRIRTNTQTSAHNILYNCILLPEPAAMAGKDDVEAEVEASAGGSRFGVANDSGGAGRLLDGGCWMVWMECPPSMEGRLCGPSKSYSSLTISAELGAEVVSVSPDKSVDQGKG